MKTELLTAPVFLQGARAVSVKSSRTMAELFVKGARGLPFADSVSLCGTQGDSRVLEFSDGSFAGVCEAPGFDPAWVSCHGEFQRFAESWD